MKYICPVCGYNQLDEPPTRFEVCPSCGTEFGNDDYFNTHDELRAKWIANGMSWWDAPEYRPPDWNPKEQLNNLVRPEVKASLEASMRDNVEVWRELGKL
jgi:hypothetical protein